MGKFVKMFKSLPPELRMMLAMVGLGSPVGAIYFLRRFFPGTPLWLLILYVGLAIAGIAILAFIIAKIFGRGAKKRSKKMANELASDSTVGPSKVDARAAIKANNEKFFKAVRDMRREARVSVYDLPWYVVIGDSGCGKTFLVNNGGLTFSLGKPEGYQLGTLNYNWWFTEDAVFIDMAGRLCNPQDDGDRREWESFLETVGRGRRGFPINGTILCISMEHLLEDAPEKHESDAVIALERLRDLQSKLGVTFATYVVITKSDRLVGFLQYFDRPDKGAIKNQMFGWSRPGDFNELHDPEQFQGVFDSIYARLHELRLRRLNDDAGEIDLGLAYAFPEEFRRLYQPLQTYVRILFPHLKKTHAVKNLLFRGLYFTSATQDDMIPPGTVERYGAEGADQLAKLQGLFPKTAYFIKDVMFRKIFPEHGLVFRNEQEVVRNRKLAHLLKYGTFGLAVILLTAFIFSFYKFEKLILDPREHVSEVAVAYAKGMSTDERLDHAEKIGVEIARLENNLGYARILSINIGTRKPIEHLKTIRVQLIESAIVEALGEIDAALRSGEAARIIAGAPAEKYLSALKAYISWFGCMEQSEATHLKFDSFEAMGSIVSESTAIANREKFLRQVKWYFEAIGRDSHLQPNPAKLLTRVSGDPAETVLDALGHVYKYFRRHHAALDEAQLADRTMREWVRILNACALAEGSYKAMMDLASGANRIETQSQLQSFTREFGGKFAEFKAALDGTTWGYGATGGAPTFKPMAEVILEQYQTWHAYQDELRAITTSTACPVLGQPILDSIKAISDDDPSLAREGLDCVFWHNLRGAKLTIDRMCDKKILAAFQEGDLEGLVKDVFAVYDAIIEYVPATEKFGEPKLELRSDATKVLERLEEIANGLNMKLSVPEDLSRELADAWDKDLLELLDAAVKAEEGKTALEAPLEVASFWRSKDLGLLYGEFRRLARLGRGTVLLTTMRDRLRQLDESTWGFAGMIPWDSRSSTERSPYTISLRSPDREDGRGRRFRDEPAEEPTAPKRGSTSRWSDRRRGRSGRDSGDRGDSRAAPRRKSAGRTAKGRIPACAAHNFLNARAREMASLLDDLEGMRELRAFLSLREEDERLDVQCAAELKRVGQAYMREYVRAWNSAYADIKLEKLDRLKKRTRSWDDLVSQLGTESRSGSITPDDVALEFEGALATILQAIPFATYDLRNGDWETGNPDWPEWSDVADWMYDAQADLWKHAKIGGGAVRKRADDKGGSTPPWDDVSEEFTEAWRNLCAGIRQNSELPVSFEQPRRWSSESIPWGEIERLRERYSLGDDEKLTGALIEFEHTMQELLSVEITRILVEIQDRYFGRISPDQGWPFLSGKKYTESGLETVAFEKFKGFLVEVHRADEAFQEVTKMLPESDAGRRGRQLFFRRCRDWYEFLGLEDKMKTSQKTLGVVVRAGVGTEDATAPLFGKRFDDTAQWGAKMVVVDLGLKIRSSDEGEDDGALRIRTMTEYKKRDRDALWEWKRVEGKRMVVRLDQVLPGVILPDGNEKSMGMSSPLAFCTYLFRYGDTRDNRTWYVMHGFKRERPGTGDGAHKDFGTFGERLIITLERRMPDPIPRISRPSDS